MQGLPTTLYKAIVVNGRNVCVDINHLQATTKVVKTAREYELAIGQGWCIGPSEAMAQLEREQDAVSTAAAERAFDDRRLSEPAQAEADAVDREAGFTFVPEIPEAPKKRGRPKKQV